MSARERGMLRCLPGIETLRHYQPAWLMVRARELNGSTRRMSWSAKRGSKTLRSCEFLRNSDDL